MPHAVRPVPLPRFPHRHSENLDWMEQARCVGMPPEDFFPHKPSGGSRKPGASNPAAQRIIREACNHCPVVMECLRYAYDTKATAGVWGGREFGTRRKDIDDE